MAEKTVIKIITKQEKRGSQKNGRQLTGIKENTSVIGSPRNRGAFFIAIDL